MGASACTKCEEDTRPSNRTFTSIMEMQKQFKKYAEDNLLGLYGRRLQYAIEKLYTLQQFHICDLLIKLSCEKRLAERDDLLIDIQKIDLQQLDHLSTIQNVGNTLDRTSLNVSNLYLGDQDYNTSGLKYNYQRNLKHKEKSTQHYQKILHSQKFAIFATVECFGSFDILVPSKLPSKKTALQIFLEKVQTLNSNYHCSLNIIFIVNPLHEKQFDTEIDRYMKGRDLESSRDTETSMFDFKFQKLLYKPVFPCVDQNSKIVLENTRVKFEYSSGDFIGYLMKDPHVDKFLQKYEYIQFANISNIAEEIVEKESLLYLSSHPEVSIIAHATEQSPILDTVECIRVKRSFIQTEKVKSAKINKNIYHLSETYYFRSSLFLHQQSNILFHKLISTRIQSQIINSQSIHFVRTLKSILYTPITLLLIKESPDGLSGHAKSPIIAYSNFCKKVIGLKESSDEQIVEVCPQILFGPREQLKTILQKLRKLPKIGFPLVISKQKIEGSAERGRV